MRKPYQNILLVAGARPNFMKIAPVIRELERRNQHIRYQLVHTGQHYDHAMSDVFFRELGIPEPDIYLDVGSGSHAEQTAKIMIRFEQACQDTKPDIVVVFGDVNSTLASSIVAKKLNIDVAHVEAGLRSRDMGMPEEVNRIVTDSISDLLFVTEKDGVNNLRTEGKPESHIHYVGNVMIDNLLYQLNKLEGENTASFDSVKIKNSLAMTYGVVTMHRPSNVDTKKSLEILTGALSNISDKIPLVWPLHPRTGSKIEQYSTKLNNNIITTKPLSYMDFLNLWKDAKVVITDSGGLQEETTALGVPCLTIRENTERPITVSEGTNILIGTNPVLLEQEVDNILSGNCKRGNIPDLWDGKASERIVDILLNK